MRFDKICALLTLCAICALSVHSADAKTASAGQYCHGLISKPCYDCPEGCYCKGGSDFGVWQVEKGCKNRWSSVTSELNSHGVFLCPNGYEKSNSGAKSENECYKYQGSTKVYATARGCDAGKYLPAGSDKNASCVQCPDGYKCPRFSYALIPTINGLLTQDTGLIKCPSGQTNNEARTDCITVPSAECRAGTYLPANTESCASCPSGFICPGSNGEKWTKQSYDQGKEACEGNSVPNANQTACVSGDVNCIAGTYLPANTKTCAACPEGYVCAGGAFSQQPIDQGKDRCSGDKVPNEQKTACVSCAAGQKPNDDNTACSDADIVVSPGWYLPANAVQQRQCFGEKKYCPGGEYSKKSTEQGRFDCPYNSNPTKNRAACELKLTKDQLKFGPLGKQGSIECWAMTSPEDYTACVYGVRTNK